MDDYKRGIAIKMFSTKIITSSQGFLPEIVVLYFEINFFIFIIVKNKNSNLNCIKIFVFIDNLS
jgi:hypothetical protein